MRVGRIALGLLAGVAAGALWKRYSSSQSTGTESGTNNANASKRYVGSTGSKNQAEQTSKSYSTQLEGAGSSGPKARVPYNQSSSDLKTAMG